MLALRKDPAISRRIFEGFTADNAKGLEAKGFEATPRNLYLAHFLGLSGARSALTDDPANPVSLRVSKANPFLKGKDIQFLLDWADRKIRG